MSNPTTGNISAEEGEALFFQQMKEVTRKTVDEKKEAKADLKRKYRRE